jgi:hypothetical protein
LRGVTPVQAVTLPSAAKLVEAGSVHQQLFERQSATGDIDWDALLGCLRRFNQQNAISPSEPRGILDTPAIPLPKPPAR